VAGWRVVGQTTSAIYNSLVIDATAIGIITYRPVNRFESKKIGNGRIAKLRAAIQKRREEIANLKRVEDVTTDIKSLVDVVREHNIACTTEDDMKSKPHAGHDDAVRSARNDGVGPADVYREDGAWVYDAPETHPAQPVKPGGIPEFLKVDPAARAESWVQNPPLLKERTMSQIAAEERSAGLKIKKERGESKTAIIAALLVRDGGCTTVDILEATGWPTVSVPAMAEAAGLSLRKEKVPGSKTRYYGK
jgi:hypothetical protein